MQSIAELARCAKGSLYELFGSRDELLEAVVNHEAERLQAMIDAARRDASGSDLNTAVRTRVIALFTYASQHPDGFIVLSRAALDAGSPAESGLDRVRTNVRDRLTHDLGALPALMIIGLLRAVALETIANGTAAQANIDAVTAFIAGGLRELHHLQRQGTK
jgi:AcrR family transcriptional regulator